MIFVSIIIIGIIVLAGWLLHGWVDSHALAVLVGDRWNIQAEGWAALWPTLAVGLLAGGVIAFLAGLLLSKKLWEVIGDNRTEAAKQAEKELHQQRLELSKERAEIDKKIQEISEERIKSIQERVEKIYQENEELKANLRKNQVLYDRMKVRMTNAISARKRHQNKHN